VADRVNRPVVVLGRVEGILVTADLDRVVQSGEGQGAHSRRPERRHQQTVIPPRVDAEHGARRVATQAIRDQPFILEGRGEIQQRRAVQTLGREGEPSANAHRRIPSFRALRRHGASLQNQHYACALAGVGSPSHNCP